MKFNLAKIIFGVLAMAIAPLITVSGVYAQDTAQKEAAPAAETVTAPVETEPLSNEGKEEKKEEDMAIAELSLVEMLNMKITTASKFAQAIRDIPASVVVVTREDIRKFGYQSVEEILQNIPGMYMIDDYNWTGTKNFGVRGFFSTGNFKNMIVMINGVRQVNGVWDSYDSQIFSVPVQAIDRIEVVRGPMSVMYGSGAFFGAVNIFTNDQYNDDPVSMLSASAGNYKTEKLFARMSGRENDLSYSLNASLNKDDGISVPFSDLMSNPEIAALPPDQGGWNLNTDETDGFLSYERKSVSLAAKYKDLSVDVSYVTCENGMPDFSMFGADPGHRLFTDSARAYLTYEKKATDWIAVVLKGGYHYTNSLYDYQWFYSDAYAMMENTDHTYEAELNTIITPTPDINIILGLSMQEAEIQNRADYPEIPVYFVNDKQVNDLSITSEAVFMQADWRMTDKFMILGGIRWDRTEDYTIGADGGYPDNRTHIQRDIEGEDTFIPRAAAIFQPNVNHAFKLLFGKAVKNASFINQHAQMMGDNPVLSPEEIQTYEVNYLGNITQKIQVGASLFRNELSDLIMRTNIYDPTTHSLKITSMNSGEMTTHGAELSLLVKPLKHLTLDLAVTYQDTKDETEGFEDIEPGYCPQWLGYIKAAYEFPRNITLGLTGRYVGEMESEWDRANVDETGKPVVEPGDPYNGRIGYKVDDYILFNANLRADKLFNKGFYLNANISNLFDEEIRYPMTTTTDFVDKGYIDYGRRWLFTVGYEW